MKPKNVSVSVYQPEWDKGELQVSLTFELSGIRLDTEAACPDPLHADATKQGKRIAEHSRKRIAKQIKKVIETIEFPSEDT